MNFRKTFPQLAPVALIGIAACAVQSGEPVAKQDPFGDFNLGGKGDMLDKAHIVRDIDLNSRITGTYNRKMRVLGFTVQAKTGAVLDVTHVSKAGADSWDVEEGAELDSVVAFYGPMTENGKKGERLAYADDDEETMAAQLGSVEIPQDGTYVFLMTSWDDPGKGKFTIDVGCKGTDFQCRRPVQDLPCEDGTEYIVGGGPVGTASWNRCNYVLLESTIVEPEAILSILPGVTVTGNFIDNGQPGGSVHLEVQGTLQAVGTEEHPVVFTAIKELWGGMVLQGNNNHLEHVYVEKADVGITVLGIDNVIKHANVNTSNLGLRFEEGAAAKISEINVTQVNDGISIGKAEVTIEDTIIAGHGEQGIGIDGRETVKSDFSRALVTGFETGIRLYASEFMMVDSSITKNVNGVLVTGEETGVTPGWECPDMPNHPVTNVPRPPRRTSWWYRDPFFVHTDVVHNSGYAVRLDAPELLVIEDSNITDNGAGVVVWANELHDDSHITRTNLQRNGEGLVQLDTAHINGVLDISGNYWAQITDPELSASWLTSHSIDVNCSRNHTNNWSGCNYNSSKDNYTCGAYECGRYTPRRCTLDLDVVWESEVSFTGFSPVEFEKAGPRVPLSDSVNDKRQELGLDALE